MPACRARPNEIGLLMVCGVDGVLGESLPVWATAVLFRCGECEMGSECHSSGRLVEHGQFCPEQGGA